MSTYDKEEFMNYKRRIMHNVGFNKAKVLHHIGDRWSRKEERKLAIRFKRGVPLDTICKVHRRDVGGIISRLASLNLIQQSGSSACYFDTCNGDTYKTFDEIKEIKLKINRFVELKS